jgi:hypothetical protein
VPEYLRVPSRGRRFIQPRSRRPVCGRRTPR